MSTVVELVEQYLPGSSVSTVLHSLQGWFEDELADYILALMHLAAADKEEEGDNEATISRMQEALLACRYFYVIYVKKELPDAERVDTPLGPSNGGPSVDSQ